LSHLLPLPERAQENASDQQPARAAAQGSAQEDQGGRAVPERGERATPGDGTPAAHPRELAGAALPRHAAALRAGAARRGSGSRRLSRPATPTPDSFTQKRLRHQDQSLYCPHGLSQLVIIMLDWRWGELAEHPCAF